MARLTADILLDFGPDRSTCATNGDWTEHLDHPMPGCTANSEAPVTGITTSMMMAYAAMRNGVTPNRAGGDGTLIEAMLAFNSGENPQYVLLPRLFICPFPSKFCRDIP